jgi:hypothetical protein
MNDGQRDFLGTPLGRPDGIAEDLGVFRETQAPQQPLAWNSAVGLIGQKSRESAARADHRIEQPAGGEAAAKIEPVRENPLDTQIIREGVHDVVKTLADENDITAGGQDFLQFLDAAGLEPGLQEIVKEFLPEEVEPVPALASQYGVEQAGREDTVRRVEEWPSDGEHTHQSPARPTLEKTLRVPAEEADGPHSRQIQQAALDAPENEIVRGCPFSTLTPGDFVSVSGSR